MATFVVYKTESCPYCHAAKDFLAALQKQRPDIEVKMVDANQRPDKFQAIATLVGRSTVPQIFLDRQYVGGWSELAAAASTGTIDHYLETGEWKPPQKQGRKTKKEKVDSGDESTGARRRWWRRNPA